MFKQLNIDDRLRVVRRTVRSKQMDYYLTVLHYTSVVDGMCLCGVVATAFLEFWKRREAVHQYDWDITPGDEVERLRPQYEIKVKYRKVNPVTQVRLVIVFILNITNIFSALRNVFYDM